MDEKTLKIAENIFDFANTNAGGSVSALYIFENHNKDNWETVDIKMAFNLLEKHSILKNITPGVGYKDEIQYRLTDFGESLKQSGQRLADFIKQKDEQEAKKEAVEVGKANRDLELKEMPILQNNRRDILSSIAVIVAILTIILKVCGCF